MNFQSTDRHLQQGAAISFHEYILAAGMTVFIHNNYSTYPVCLTIYLKHPNYI